MFVNAGESVYRAVARAAPVVLRAAAPLNDRLSRAVSGRREALPSMEAWARRERDPARPLVWLHAPSVGEALMAQAILEAMRRAEPALQAAFTFFSPSAERVAPRVGADWYGYLPWDREQDVRLALDALRPTSISFVRTEIWPVLVAAAAARGVPSCLLNAVLSSGSSRTSAGARFLLGAAYRRLHAIGAVTAEDGARFAALGVDSSTVTVTGDARFDQVWRRVGSIQPSPLVDALRQAPGTCVVAGSTWPADERVLLSALAGVRGEGKWRLVVAPHEPTPAHVSGLERALRAAGLTHARLPDMSVSDVPPVDALVVDRVGVLADLYAAADVAYVGGGFGAAGLHSVVEPAALAVPVLFGPRHGNAGEAARLAASGGGRIAGDGAALAGALLHWGSGSGRTVDGNAAADAARAFVRGELGAAERNALLALTQRS
jgi:3-deoxy-D-manno-octulosonic-acid transferase